MSVYVWVCVCVHILRYLFSLCMFVCVCIFWEIYYLRECLFQSAFLIFILCVCMCTELKPARTWLQLATFMLQLLRKICLSYLKWRLFWWRGDRPNVLHYHDASRNLYPNPGWSKQKREHLHNVGAWCYPAELDLSTLFFSTPPSSLVLPLSVFDSLCFPPSFALSHRGWIVLLRLGRGHGWEKCRGGS